MMYIVLLAAWLSSNVSDGDAFFAKMDYPSAIYVYEQVLQREPDNAEVLWKLARAHICLGDVSEGDHVENHYRQSEQYARRCVELQKDLADGHVWLAAALGSIAMYEGAKTKVKLAREIKKEIDIALALDPDHDAAYSLLGSFHRAIGGVSWLERSLADLLLGGLPKGGYDEGEKAFKKAIALRPDAIRHQFELGMLYWEWGKKAEAIRWFNQAKQLQAQMASDHRRLRRITRLLDDTQ